ncbi:ParB/RepB/Spo0J family partition protein [Bifidobacterium sp. ESL0790]|uniref:ParB/RepB/Spo0J family partition protein n=1 Tax=Bifidobacterium sp. ESL0790 TaxID=2983233 RepID=UPI0023F7C6C9|nr:ParB/RepB/Spo0J family partition protein [Bifidobacterium sp. ESL0790]WEV72417.1 ParB/RepB/Spo0J family partition protein [Bifidobacterium sp. ESL0790]
MASKSRLGKGLGALFPALPGDPNQAQPVTKSEETAANKLASEKGQASKQNVSRETSPSGGKATSKESAKSKASGSKDFNAIKPATAKSETVAKENVSRETLRKTGKSNTAGTKKNLRKNVSRETSRNKGKKRRSMPSFDGIAGPSDVFFGGAVVPKGKQQNNKESESKNSAESAPSTEGLKPVQGGYLVELRLDQIGPNVHQPRSIFDEDELRELAASLKEVGVLQPVVVRKRPKDQKLQQSALTIVGKNVKQKQQGFDSEYELIMGERRWRAAHLAGLKTIPAIVKTTTDDEMLRDALLENLHRVALNPLEEAAAYQQMMDDFGLTQEQLSHSVSKSRPQIANMLRLLNLPPAVQKKVAAGVLSAGHARALLGLSTPEEMDKLANRIIAEGLSVRSTEEIVAMKSMDGSQKEQQKDHKKANPWSESPIQRNLENRFDTKVAIKGNKKHGKIEIVFSSPEDMDRILGLLMPNNAQKKESGWV